MPDEISLENQMKELIFKFRDEYRKLSKEEKTNIPDLFNLNKPCQADIIYVDDRELDVYLQINLFTRWEDEEDLKIEIEQMDISKYIDSLEKKVKDKKWNKLLPENERYPIIGRMKYSDVIKGIFINEISNFNRYIQNLQLNKDIKPITPKWLITKDCFCWVFIGTQEIKIDEIINEIVLEIKKTNELKNQSQKTNEDKLIEGYGTYFYPPIWIGDTPNPSFKDIVYKKPIMEYIIKIYDTKYEDKLIIVQNNGFIVVEEKDKTEALTILNEIMASAILLEIPTSLINESELLEVKIDPEIKEIRSISGGINSMRTLLLNKEWEMPDFIELKRINLDKNHIVELFNIANNIRKDADLIKFLNFYLEGFTFFQNYSYSQSFLMSWLIIERYLSLLWEKKVISTVKGSTRKNDLKNHGRWSAYYIIETLNFLGIEKDENYKTFMKLKRKRDKIIHEGQECSMEEAEECLKLAKLILIDGLEPDNILGDHIL